MTFKSDILIYTSLGIPTEGTLIRWVLGWKDEMKNGKRVFTIETIGATYKINVDRILAIYQIDIENSIPVLNKVKLW